MVDRAQIRIEPATVKLLTQQCAKGLGFPVVFLLPTHLRGAAPDQELSPESRRTLYVGLTRASEQLTIGAVYESHTPLLDLLPTSHYRVEGTRAREFIGTRGRRLGSNPTRVL